MYYGPVPSTWKRGEYVIVTGLEDWFLYAAPITVPVPYPQGIAEIIDSAILTMMEKPQV